MRLIILGAGKYGREIEDVVAQTMTYDRIDFLDAYAESPRVVGKCADFTRFIDDGTAFFVAFGDNNMRERRLKALFDAEAHVVNIIHPTAYISPTAKLGRGVAALPKALVNSYCVIEDGCMANSGAIVDHDTTVGAYAHVCVGAIVKTDNRIPGKMKVEAGVVIERNAYR
jgi:UDP-3-O-[3-hydroxymyristoyl] glucosamine N-acyltransferase